MELGLTAVPQSLKKRSEYLLGPLFTIFHIHTLLFSAFQAEGILSLIAAPQNPIAIIATAAMPTNTFFIELFLSLSLNLDYSFSIPLNY